MKKLFKKGLTLLLVCAMVLCQYGDNYADVTGGNILLKEVSGEGTVDNPYLISAVEDIPETIEADTVYALENDIVLTADTSQIDNIEGILDGRGHTITLVDKPLANSVSGTIQNLGIKGDSVITGSDTFGSMAVTLTGSIKNCYSTVSVTLSGYMGDVGGLVGTLYGGTIKNSYYAGTVNPSWEGGVAGVCYKSGSGEVSKISNCIYPQSYSGIAMGASNAELKNCNAMALGDFLGSTAVELLNTEIEDIGFEWTIPTDGSNNGYPVLSVPSNTGIVDKSGLEKAISVAEEFVKDDYTEDTWKILVEALGEAKIVKEDQEAVKSEVLNATSKLNAAIQGLAKRKPTKPVAMPENESEIIHIKSMDELENITGTEGSYYVLDNDITMDSRYYFNFVSFNGVLDGKGHTVTFENMTRGIFNDVGNSGVVQNIYFTGTISSSSYIGPLGSGMSGTIINCYSDVKGDKACGFARRLLDDGWVSNSYSISQGKGGVFFNEYGNASEEQKSKGRLNNTYWRDVLDNSAIPSSAMIGSYAMEKNAMRTKDFVALLNQNRGEYGTEWGQSGANGYPYFGADQDYAPEEYLPGNKYTVTFTKQDGSVTVVENQKLELSPDNVDGFQIAGNFGLEDVPESSTIIWEISEIDPENSLMIGADNGDIRINKSGTAVVTATENKADGTSERVAAVYVDATARDVEAIRLLIDNQDVTDSVYTLAGSEWKNIQVQVKYAGTEEYVGVATNRFTCTPKDEEYIYNLSGSFSFKFKKPGTSAITVTYNDNPEIKAEITATSTYVPVTSVKPAISGKVTIHGRNANSTGEKDFNPDYSSVIVEPANASNSENYTIESSDKAVGQYVPSMVVGYVPYKAGTVTYTAVIHDTNPETGETNIVSGESTVEYEYLNPLTSVTVDNREISLINNTEVALDMTFAGEKSSEGYSVTEPEINWTYSEEGIVRIERKNPYGWKRDEKAPDNNCWLPNTDYYVYALGEGTVTATGTPVDKSGNVEPIVITITVTPGDVAAPELDKLSSQGIQGALVYAEKNINKSFVYNDEWALYALVRAGESLTQKQIDDYYSSVMSEIEKWNSSTKLTDIERTSLTMSLLGKDITDLDGVNLAEMIYNRWSLGNGSNELIYALLALDAKNTEIPENALWTREALIEKLLTYQTDDGGFGLTDNNSAGIDTTAMALQALAKYENTNDNVKAAISKALDYLKVNCDVECDFGSAEATAQVLLALTSLGINPASANGLGTAYKNTVIALMGYYSEDPAGFAHTKGDAVNSMATIQCLQALTAYANYLAKEDSYWNLVNVPALQPGDSGNTSEDRKKAEVVIKKISAIGDVTLGSEAAIVEARTAYNALNATQKALITNYELLQTAELKLAQLKGETEQIIFSLIGDTVHGSTGHLQYVNWLTEITVMVKKEATAGDAIRQALKANGYQVEGYENYISAVITPDGTKLEEFSNGTNSGWKYSVNGRTPNVGVDSYKIKSGDKIVLYYVDDYTQDNTPAEPATKPSEEQSNDNSNNQTTVSSDKNAKANKTVKNTKPKLKVKAKKKSIKLSWKKVSKANGYTIYRALKKKGKYVKIKTIKKGRKKKFTDKKVKKGKKYFYKIRAYRIDANGKKIYSKWSKVKKIKLVDFL
ncbi:MAG: DUF4430 domain-containing protein [Eubacterium sp.]